MNPVSDLSERRDQAAVEPEWRTRLTRRRDGVARALRERDMWARLVADAVVDGDSENLADYVLKYVTARREANEAVVDAGRAARG